MDSKTIKLKSNSPVFRKFVTDLDTILSKVYAKDVQGNPIKDTDAIFAVALGQVDSALVASFNLSKLQQINPRLTAAVYTAAESKPILLPVLCYIKGTISQGDLQLIKQQFMHAAQPEQKSLLEILHIDAWRPQL